MAGKSAFVRLLGQGVPLEIEYADPVEIESLYRKKFERVFGYFPDGRELEVHSLRILVAGASPSRKKKAFPESSLRKPAEGALVRDAIEPGERIAGPCLVADDFGTLWIEKGWIACMGTRGSLLLELNECTDSSLSFPAAARRELFASRFLCLVEEMGAQLERTALSVNVRERLDFSCALLDRAGYLVANAPHIPVHLGAMGVCARRLLELFPNLRPGDVLVSNHPAFGGSHLPGATVLAPVFGTGRQTLLLPGQPGPSCRDWRCLARFHARGNQFPFRRRGGPFPSLAFRIRRIEDGSARRTSSLLLSSLPSARSEPGRPLRSNRVPPPRNGSNGGTRPRTRGKRVGRTNGRPA